MINVFNITKSELDIWINKLLNSQRVSTFPSTVNHDSNIFAECLEHSKCSGIFYIPDNIYNEILFFKNKEIDTTCHYRTSS